ncbi:glycosyltransferase family 9 protein [Paraburkholderia sp. J41]|uniref:glycosyltransferase family 9 protein n=1 Tax=Paraburkholderia sp. J41 TaxID=2805433 RepID=UPI002AC3335B|nr:glycosyltransferase family 9 protein [Paraburkholderia sp. J41]
MTPFFDAVKHFHFLCDENQPSKALGVLRAAEQYRSTPQEYVEQGLCYSRIGMFGDAEHALNCAWPSLVPREEVTIRAVQEMAAVKLHLEKFDEAAALEGLVMSRDWWRPPPGLPSDKQDEFRTVILDRIITQEQSVAGKDIFLLLAGGAGDVIEHSRYIQCLIAEGVRTVFMDPNPPLWELFSNSSIPVKLERATVNNIARCDAVVFANLLHWRYRHADLSMLPPRGYMKSTRQRKFSVRLSRSEEKMSVGIVWRSVNSSYQSCRHEPFRSMSLSSLEPILASEKVIFYSLQYGDYSDAERGMLERFGVLDASPYIRSFADLADVMMQLDLVISIDSAPAHLAGALDVPVWNLLANVADWRWGPNDRKTTSLYPSMKLFRQRTLGDWTSVTADIAVEMLRM